MDGGEPGKRLWELPEAVHRVYVGGADPLVPEKRSKREREGEREGEREEREREKSESEKEDIFPFFL